MKKLFFIFICLINLCFADEAVPHLYILHINGVNTVEEDAVTNADKLAAITTIISNMMTFSYVYNPTSGGDKNPGLWTNLMDVAKQKMFEGKDSMTLDDFTRAWLLNEGKDPDRMTPQEYAEAKAGIEDDYKKVLNGEFGDNIDAIIDNFHGNVPVEFKSVVDLLNTPYVPHPLAATYQIADDRHEPTESQLQMITMFNNYMKTHPLKNHETLDYSKTKNLVLLVPHSQGNLYANDLYTYLTKQEHFPEHQLAIYGIASPADHINGDWAAKFWQDYAKISKYMADNFLPLDSYITSTHDFVINSARTVFYSNPAMPGNIDTPIGHNLVDVYLSDPKARAQIDKMITFEADVLVVDNMGYGPQNMQKMGIAMNAGYYLGLMGTVL